MSKRLFETEFWNGKYVRGLGRDENHLYSYLITNPQNTIAGIFDDQADLFAMHTKIAQEDVEAAIAKFERDGKVVRLPADDKIALTKWGKHQSSSRDVAAGFSRIMSTLSQDSLNILQDSVYTLPPRTSWKIIMEGIKKLQEGESTYRKQEGVNTDPTLSQHDVGLNQTKPNQTPLGGGLVVGSPPPPADAGSGEAAAGGLTLTWEQLEQLDREFPDADIEAEYERARRYDGRITNAMSFMRGRLRKIGEGGAHA